MNALFILMLSLPIFFLILLFVGIVKKNKRLWIADVTLWVPVYEKNPESIVQKTSVTD